MIVWPSGADFAVISVPTIVLAPGRLSTITRCPRPSPVLSASMRASVSLPPPGGYGEMNRMGRLENCCAWAAMAAAAHQESIRDAAAALFTKFSSGLLLDEPETYPTCRADSNEQPVGLAIMNSGYEQMGSRAWLVPSRQAVMGYLLV